MTSDPAPVWLPHTPVWLPHTPCVVSTQRQVCGSGSGAVRVRAARGKVWGRGVPRKIATPRCGGTSPAEEKSGQAAEKAGLAAEKSGPAAEKSDVAAAK